MTTEDDNQPIDSKLKSQTLNGLSWSLLNQFIGIFTTQIIGIVLARILGPSQFGLVAMVTVMTQFGQVFADLGMGSAIVQKKDLSHRDSSTAFWINCLMSVTIAGVIVLCAPAIAAFYDQPTLKVITYFIAANFVFNALGTIQDCLLQKALDFKKLFIVNTIATVLSGCVGIAMAVTGWGVWSLVAKLILFTIFKSSILWILSSWRPLFVIDRTSLKHVLNFGLPLVGTLSINYWARNIDNVMIGRVWGDASLGNYNKAYSLMLLPIRQVTGVIGRVMFPSLSTIQHDPLRVKRVFLKTMGVVALLGFPVSIGMFVLAEPIIIGLYGEKWTGAVEIFRILSLLGINQSVGSLNGVIYQSQNATKVQFKWGMVVNTLCVVAIFVGLPFGASGVAIAYTITSLLITIPNWMVLGQVIPLPLSEIMATCCAPFLASVAMGIIVFLNDYFLINNAHMLIRMCAGIALGAGVYLSLISSFRVGAFVECKKLVLEKIRNPKIADSVS